MKIALYLGIAAAICATAQPQLGYVDVYVAKVKPEKRAEFDALAKKVAEANRKNNGDYFTCSEVLYGEQNTLYFSSVRTNLAGIDDATTAFENALGKAFGAGVPKLMDDWTRCLASSRGEIRRARMDLSSGYNSTEEVIKSVGRAHYLRTAIVRVRPGHVASYEEQLKMTQGLGGIGRLVSQAVVGASGNVFYVTSFGKSFGELDTPGLPQLLGSRYADYGKMSADNVIGVENIISKYLPELSNPIPQIVEVDPDFWTPKPKPPAKQKTPTN